MPILKKAILWIYVPFLILIKNNRFFNASIAFHDITNKNWVNYSTHWVFFSREMGIKKIFKIYLRITEIEQLSGVNATLIYFNDPIIHLL